MSAAWGQRGAKGHEFAGVGFAMLGDQRLFLPQKSLPALEVWIGNRGSPKQCPRVWVCWMGVDGGCVSLLHDAALIEHNDAVREVADDGEVMRDEQVREIEVVLELTEEVEHLRLDREVERADRLVADHETRLNHQCPGNRDPLPLAAGEVDREAIRGVGGQPDPLQHRP